MFSLLQIELIRKAKLFFSCLRPGRRRKFELKSGIGMGECTWGEQNGWYCRCKWPLRRAGPFPGTIGGFWAPLRLGGLLV